MAFLNFLTQGQPLPTTESKLTTSQVPQYLSDYLYNLMSGAYSAAQEGYQTYDAPRIADFSNERLNAMQMVTGQRPSNAPPSWSPYGDEIHTMANDTGAPGADMMAPLSPGDTGDVSTTVMPYTPYSQPTGGAAMAYRPQLTAAENTATAAGGLDALKSASPYLEAASKNLPSTIQDYMNPYQQNVINTMGDEARRQLQEKILPAIGDQFTRAGQYGSSRQQEIAQRGVRDIASDLEANIGKQLAQGYTTAGTQAQADLTRQAELAKTAGTLTGTEEVNKAALANIQAGLAAKEQSMGLSGAAAVEAVGAEQEAMNQRNLDLRYKDFIDQTQYPKQQISFLSDIVRGLPAGGSTLSSSGTSSGSLYSASPLASLATGLSSAASLSNLVKP
tara:strand:+ start:7189 stop:8358 length:1170 start_codon:yes stop_codon:yes gene_type:complete